MDRKWDLDRIRLELYNLIDRRLVDIETNLAGAVQDVTIDAPFTTTEVDGVIDISFDPYTLFVALLDSLPGPYDSDEDALTNGMLVGEWYLTSDQHVSGSYGLAKKIHGSAVP